MTIESPVSYTSDLNASYPGATDAKSEGDDHIRNIKTALKNTFVNIAGAVTPTHTELNYVDGVTSALAGISDVATLTNKTLTSPKIGTSILDTNGNELFKLTATSSAVNELTYANAATGNAPTFTASGGDDNIGINFAPKGTGTVQIAGADIAVETLVQNSQSAAYELVLSDAGKHILHPSADTTARTITIPANSSVAFPVGTVVTFVNQVSAGVLSIAITTDTMRLAGAGTTGTRALAANGIATAIKITSTEWLISGTGLS